MRLNSVQCVCFTCWTLWTAVNAFGVGRVHRPLSTHFKPVLSTAKRQSVYLGTTHEDLSESSVSWSSSLKESISRVWNNGLRSKSTTTVVAGLALYYFYKGLLSTLGAARFWQREGDMILQPLSVATWSGELIGWVTLSKSMVYFLVGIARLPPLQSSALSAFPILAFMISGILSRSLEILGFRAFFAPLVILYGSLVNVLIFTKFTPRKSLQNYLYLPLTLAGLLSWLFPEFSSSFVGIELKTAMDKVLWVFLGRSILSSSTLLYTLLLTRGTEISKAMRNMTAVTGLTTLLDVMFIRRALLLDACFSLEKAYRFILLSLSSSTLLFILLGT